MASRNARTRDHAHVAPVALKQTFAGGAQPWAHKSHLFHASSDVIVAKSSPNLSEKSRRGAVPVAHNRASLPPSPHLLPSTAQAKLIATAVDHQRRLYTNLRSQALDTIATLKVQDASKLSKA